MTEIGWIRKMKAPCRSCSNKGCGTYHDICPEYKEWKAEIEAVSVSRQKEGQKHREYVKPSTFKCRKNTKAFKRHMK